MCPRCKKENELEYTSRIDENIKICNECNIREILIENKLEEPNLMEKRFAAWIIDKILSSNDKFKNRKIMKIRKLYF